MLEIRGFVQSAYVPIMDYPFDRIQATRVDWKELSYLWIAGDDYKGSLTREQFLFYEIRVAAKLINEGCTRQEVNESDYQ